MACVLCNSIATEKVSQTKDIYYVVCENCGKYGISGLVRDTVSSVGDEDKALISHYIWLHQQDNSNLYIDEEFLLSYKSKFSFPNTKQKIELLIEYLGLQTGEVGERVEFTTLNLRAKIGVRSKEAVRQVLKGAEREGLIEQDTHLKGGSITLTVEGGIRCEESLESRKHKPSTAKAASEGEELAVIHSARDEGVSGIEVFIAYSKEDDPHREQVEKHLSILRQEGKIEIWYFRLIDPGENWNSEIDKRINSAQLILLLISSDFFGSDYCYKIEMKRALERNETKEAKVVPIILRDCDWHHSPIGKLQALPKDGKPITNWSNWDDGYADMARGIRQVVKSLIPALGEPE